MECVSAVAGECTKTAIVHVEREFGYPIHFTRSTNTLRYKIEQLTAIKTQVQELTGAALRNGELIKETVEEWMTRVDIVLSQATRLSDEASVIKGWFRGWCCGRFSLGRKAHKTIEDIQRVYDEGSGFGDNVSYLKPTQNLKLLGIDGFNAFASRDSTTVEIRNALLNDAINLVGVYGMPGVGKTALIKEITKQVKEEELFEEVVVVTVSQNLNLVKLQDDIAEGLDLKDLGVDLSRRAQKLSDRLNQDTKTTLVVLDDVWEKIELFEVGIPYKNNGKCCKVVFTTRYEAVCDRMEANIKKEVVVLSEEDSWILFQQKSGNVADSSLAYDVLKECKGLPLAIITLGLALRNKDTIVWKDALQQLRKSIFFKGMSPVNSSIKLSYNFLGSKSLKIFFLFCCLFPEDHEIELDVLLSYVMGEKLLEDVDTYDEARDRLYSRVDELVSSGLLLRVSLRWRDGKEKRIMMHDVVRDVAISIAREDEGHIVKAGMNQSYWPNMDLENCKRLSMMHNPIERFPTIPIEAPHLQSLFLNNNYQLTELPSDFFAAMKSLKTLDLSHTCITSLPPSLSCLQSLHTLLLNNTRLKNLSPIGKLVRLEVLSLNGSDCWDNRVLEEVVEQIGNLSNLRILDLTNASLSSSIKPDLFFKLRRLEKFHMLDSSDPLLDGFGNRRIEVFPEMGSLSRLTFLEVQVFNPKLCNIDIPGPWQNLTTFRIAVSSSFVGMEVPYSHFSRVLFLESMEFEIKELANWVLVLLGRTNYLQIVLCPNLQSLIELAAAAEGMNENLEYLDLKGCNKMGCVFTNTGLLESNQNVVFGNLQELELAVMDALVEICQGTPPPRLLQKLKTLKFMLCDSLVTAIHCKLIQNLQNLEHLRIEYCSKLEHVVEMVEEESVEGRIPMEQPFLLPIFPNLKKFELWEIPKIKYLFTMRVARNLLMLEKIQLHECEEMEVLFKYEDGEDTQFNEDTAILPRLKKLFVKGAPQLKSFTNQNLVMELLSLEKLRFFLCGNLERLPFQATSVPNLKSLKMNQEAFARLEWEDESVKERIQAVVRGYYDIDDDEW